ncbi:MAG TPA: phenylalanine--tRNA ligase subunit alpha [Actinomycetota bacterium]|nr:phenylalanine--tRNA ligase subunit alpha [Actinomycetota bacterium]
MSAPADELEAARVDGLDAIAGARDTEGLERARVQVLGRKAPLARARASLRALPEEERRAAGRRINSVQEELERALERRGAELDAREREQRWARERIDVTLPGDAPPVGALHPLTKTVWEIVDIFIGLGYGVAEGPEVELSKLNFDAMNTPPEHPARSLQDTYYVAGTNEEVCLRPHTSPVQMRVMQSQEPPIYVLAPGRVYRREELDPTHLAQFFQIEGLAVDTGITMADLKGSLEVFARALFGKDLDVRFRPHFFPFTEPSAEMDVECFVCRGRGCRVCKQSGWIEILGCGMVDPFLFDWAGYEPDRYTGFAWGMGIERIAALAHGVADIRTLYDNDVRFLHAFRDIP